MPCLFRKAGDKRGPAIVHAWLVALVFVPVAALAQDIKHYAPQPPPAAAAVVHPVPPEPLNPASDTRELIPELKAIVFVPNKEAVQPAGVEFADFRGIRRDGIDVLDPVEFDRIASAYLGKPLSLASINRLARELIVFWRAHDRPVMDVVIPEQDITTGVLQLIVFESRVGKVRAEGARWFAPALLERQVRLKPGERIAASVIDSDLDWLNNNPFRRVNLIYTPGTEAGTTDLLLKTQDRFPVRFYTGFNDSGSEPSPDKQWLRNRWDAGFNWGNAFWADHLLSYQFTTSDDFKNTRAHSVNYTIPLPWRHTVNFSASYSDSETTQGSLGSQTILRGKSEGASLRYGVPLPHTATFTESISLGVDWSRSNSNLDFGGLLQYSQPVEVRQMTAEYQSALQDRWGTTFLSLSGYYGPGNWTPADSDARYEVVTAGADSNYAAGKLSLERVTRLPGDWSFLMRGSAQTASGSLIPGSQFYIGGWDTVRGYEQGDSRGDQGYTLTTELHTPGFSLGHLARWKAAPDQLQLLMFWDYGSVSTLHPLPGEGRNTDLSSVGVGVRYNIGQWVSFRCDYGWQLIAPAAQSVSETYPGRFHMGLVISY